MPEWNMSSWSEEQKYNHLQSVWKKAQAKYAKTDESVYGFQEVDGKINLLGARGFSSGKPVTDTNTHWDDTIFVIYKDSTGKHVKEFAASTEYGTKKKKAAKGSAPQVTQNGTALLTLDFHKYKLATHKKSLAHKSIKTGGIYSHTNHYQYRALNPDPKVKIARDYDHNLIQGASESIEDSDTVNIHYGGEGDTPSDWSQGCQIIQGWDNYKAFLKLVESDHSIHGSIHNELADKPAKDGTRPVIYALVEGSFIANTEATSTTGVIPTAKPKAGEPANSSPTANQPTSSSSSQPAAQTPGATQPAAGTSTHPASQPTGTGASSKPAGQNPAEQPAASSSSQPGSNSSAPAAQKTSTTRKTDPAFAKTYAKLEKEGKGGFYPVGANLCWHGGVHLPAAENDPIYAAMPGTIVAARLSDKPESGEGPHGNRNFVLIEHSIRQKKVYSLYMHLAVHPLTENDDWVKQAAWLAKAGTRRYRIKDESRNLRKKIDSTDGAVLIPAGEKVTFLADTKDSQWKKVQSAAGVVGFMKVDPKYLVEEFGDPSERFSSGSVASLSIPVQSGDFLWGAGKLGPDETGIHFEIFSEENIVAAESRSAAFAKSGTLRNPEDTPKGWKSGSPVTVAAVHEGPKLAAVGEEISLEVWKLNFGDAPANEQAKISWQISTQADGGAEEEIERLEKKGPKLKYKVPESAEGKTLIARPYMKGPKDGLEVRTKIVESVWHECSDPNDDLNIDSADISGIMGSLLAEGNLTKEKLTDFFKNNPDGKADVLRGYVCRFPSEWGVPDMAATVDKLQAAGWEVGEADLLPYQWWGEAKSAGVALPEKHNVWHYHPIRFLEMLPFLLASTPKPGQKILKIEGPSGTKPGVWNSFEATQFADSVTQEEIDRVQWNWTGGGETHAVDVKAKAISSKFSSCHSADVLTVHAWIDKPEDGASLKISVGPCLVFDGQNLSWMDENLKVEKSWKAVSGLPGFQSSDHQGEKDKGPIPAGLWIVKFKELQHIKDQTTMQSMANAMHRGEWPGGEDRWGRHRVWLEPFSSTNTLGRSHFCIHGGKEAGSAGCIDLTSDMDRFTTFLEGLGADLILRVRYESPAPSGSAGGEEGKFYISYPYSLDEALAKQMKLNPKPQKSTGKTWIDAPEEEVKSVLNPLDHESGADLYQFIDLSGSSGLSLEAIDKFLLDKGILAGQGKAFLETAKEHHISEIYGLAHACLETGNGTSELAKGVIRGGGQKYYNMFGIHAFDKNAIETGSKYAEAMGWDSPEKAIRGGIKWIAENYINQKGFRQNTLYKMRWNPEKPGAHQYATDLRWAIAQVSRYKKFFDAFPNAKKRFEIPRYKGQPGWSEKGESAAPSSAPQQPNVQPGESPWMATALVEGARWHGSDESVITKSINYHKEVGVHLPDLNGTEHAWCASFVSYCLKKAGFALPKNPAGAPAFLDDPNFVEITTPQYGAISVIKKDHVCFLFGKDKSSDHHVFIGGNQSNTINFCIHKTGLRYFLPKAYANKANSPLKSTTPAIENKNIGIGSTGSGQVTTR